MPEKVRHRVVSLTGDALGGLSVAELPAPLRQYARFTPQRRIKFGANAIAAALESEPAFRERIAEQLRERFPELAEALTSGTPPPAADPVDVAAVAYVLRPVDWPKLVAAAGEEAQRAQAERAGEEAQRELARLRGELAEARTAARTEAERGRGELESVRKDLEVTRRKLRSAQSDVKRGEADARKARAELEELRSSAAAEKSAAESESRRLRTRLAEAESALEAGRRAAREGRSVQDMRVRLLLDSVLEAAQGLRRELALPPTTSRPADTVDAVEPGRMTPRDIAARALSETDPELLDQLLALPQSHLVVDGYNVTKTGYPTMPLDKQRLRLLGGLAGLAAQSGAEVTCVFDGAELAAPVLLAPPRGVRVLFSKPGETADELIRQLVRAEPPGRAVVVVSSDREVADGCAAAGARPVSSALLLRRLGRS
ncbi:NYN domain-containing protein [Streptomyces sp. WMMB 322]|uniref:NYN domain-containing protein n=1 Tax=Streptomyces sp. WMMB 322 TaxID=1286821 RepID=UPI0006E315E9|nr:NYN domain-containing protein [Streptomyces sp. WMMB 322]